LFNFQNISINPQQTSSSIESESQKIFIIRHGERIDSTFGVNWLDQVRFHQINIQQLNHLIGDFHLKKLFRNK